MATIVSIVAKCNGQTYDLTAPTSGSTWSKSFAAPNATSGSNNAGQGPGVGANASGLGYYPVEITITDDYGNVTTVNTSTASFGDTLKLKVLEKTVPVASITSPSSGATVHTGKPIINFKLTDSGSGIKPTECYVQIDSGTAVKVTATGSGTTYTGSYTPSSTLADGSHTIKVYGYDYDGNKSNVASSTFTIDTVPPTLNVTAPTDGLKTNKNSVTVTGSTNDTTSNPTTIAITVNGADSGAVTVNGDGSFSKVVTLSAGTNTIKVVATDASGLTSEVTRTVYYSTAKPVVTAITLTPNPSDTGATVSLTVTIQES